MDRQQADKFVDTEKDLTTVIRDPDGKITWPPALVEEEERQALDDLDHPEEPK